MTLAPAAPVELVTAGPDTAPDTTTGPDAAPEAIDLRDPIHRIVQLADAGSVAILESADGVLSATVEIKAISCVVFATDPRSSGGALGRSGCAAIVRAYAKALAMAAPVVGIWQSGGARLREGIGGLDGVGSVFASMTNASGRIPQISLVLGAAAGGAAYGPALTDVVVLSDNARVFVTGPDVVNRVTGESVDAQSLGGPNVHERLSGLAHVAAADEAGAIDSTRVIVELLSARAQTELRSASPGIDRVDPGSFLPTNKRRAYDVRPMLTSLLDAQPLELHTRWAPNVVTALGRLGGKTVGVIANNPIRLGGCLTALASDKAARFVRLCDSFGIPLVVIVDVPGYLPGSKQEADGIIRRGAKLLHAFAAARVPRFTVITNKAYGGAYIAMNSKSLGADAVYAWPGAQVDVMSSTAAVEILHRRELAAESSATRDGAVDRLAAEHAANNGGLLQAIDDGFIDRVIAPSQTREALIADLARYKARQSNERNIPL